MNALPSTIGSLDIGLGQMMMFLLPICGCGLIWFGVRLLSGSDEYLAAKAAKIGTRNPKTARIVGIFAIFAGALEIAGPLWLLLARGT